MTEPDVAGAQSLHRSFALLRLVGAHNHTGLRLMDIIHKSGLTRSTTHRMMQALDREGLVIHDDVTERYHLGPEAFILGIAAEDRFGLGSAGLTSLGALVRRSEDTALLMIRRGAHSVCVGREEGTYPVRTHVAHRGHRTPLGVGGASLAILAALPDDEIEWVLQRNAAEITEGYRAYSLPEMWNLVKETRAQGFAVNDGRIDHQSWAVAVAILDSNGRCGGALSLAGIRSRIEPRVIELAKLLSDEVRYLEERIYRTGKGFDNAGSQR